MHVSWVCSSIQSGRESGLHPQVKVSFLWMVRVSSVGTILFCYKPLQLYYLWGGCSDIHQIKAFSSVLVKVKYFCWDALGMHTSIWIQKCAGIKSHGAYGIFKEPVRREENTLKEELTHPPSLRQSVYVPLMEKGSSMSLLILMLTWWGKTLIFIVLF